jgi:butyrate kinase
LLISRGEEQRNELQESAIALEVGRAKDKARVLQFIEEGALDAASFEAIVARHGLLVRWQTFARQFLA